MIRIWPAILALAAIGCTELRAVEKRLDYGQVLINTHEDDFPMWFNDTTGPLTLGDVVMVGDPEFVRIVPPNPFTPVMLPATLKWSATVRFSPTKPGAFHSLARPKVLPVGPMTPDSDDIAVIGEGVWQVETPDLKIGGGYLIRSDGSFIG
jgi:hypothetical protein